MHVKKALFITALTMTLGVSAANAQEQPNTNDQDATVSAAAEEMAPMATTASPEGMWVRRKKGQDVKVSFRDGAMYCTIINRKKKSGKPKKDFEMCHGMTAEGDAWKGKHMKHPEMPKFMTFKGTVTVEGDVLKIKGCAGICDSEKWDRAKPSEEMMSEEMKSE